MSGDLPAAVAAVAGWTSAAFGLLVLVTLSAPDAVAADAADDQTGMCFSAASGSQPTYQSSGQSEALCFRHLLAARQMVQKTAVSCIMKHGIGHHYCLTQRCAWKGLCRYDFATKIPKPPLQCSAFLRVSYLQPSYLTRGCTWHVISIIIILIMHCLPYVIHYHGKLLHIMLMLTFEPAPVVQASNYSTAGQCCK